MATGQETREKNMDYDYVPHSHIPYGSDGSGFYTNNAEGCARAVQAATSLTLCALDTATPKKTSLVTVCDYGAADGGISVFLMRDIINFVREKHGKDVEFSIQYDDQPINDFKSLFLRMNGLIPGSPSYFKDISGVYISGIGTNFYSQCVPSNTVDLGFSSSALHWLSKRPCTLSGALFHAHATVKEEQQRFREQAAQDYDRFLLHRACELKHGGHMVILSLCIKEDGQHSGISKYYKECLLSTMGWLWKQMFEENKITKEEFQNTTLNFYFRTQSEHTVPFGNPSSLVSKAGLKLVSIETNVTRCPFHVKLMQYKDTYEDKRITAKKHAKSLIQAVRTWSNSTLFNGLSETRSTAERNGIVDDFFNRYESLVALKPHDHGLDLVHAHIHVVKQ